MDFDAYQLLPHTLLFFLDDTGIEDFSDVNHPVFGIGGCAVHESQYCSELQLPWSNIKNLYWRNKDKPIHAKKIRRKNGELARAIRKFFDERKFF